MKVAIIPARGGSTRIPRKNIKNFLGKPIIAYSIEAALQSALFERVIVSTDDEEIAAVAREWGAETPFMRPDELGLDSVGTNDVVKHAIGWLNAHDQSVDTACAIYATAPFIQVKYLRQGLDLLTKNHKSFAFSATTFPFPIKRAFKLTENGEAEMFWPEHYTTRSQHLEEAYHDAGQFYWGTADAFLNGVMMFSHASMPVILPRHMVQDIDTMEDWHRAEFMYTAMKMAE